MDLIATGATSNPSCEFRHNSQHHEPGLLMATYDTLLFFALLPIPIPKNPALTPADVTTVIATLGKSPDALFEGVQCHIKAGIQYISICTPPDTFEEIQALSIEIGKQHDRVRIDVCQASYANKRKQLASAIAQIPEDRKQVHRIIVFADDDILFPENTVRWMLAAFEKDNVGGLMGSFVTIFNVETSKF
ncbi:hypothetical protein AYO20_07364 [Fonsecaea nubica]|uniref:Glycosyltransferase 2-like domain-containing protein n=1 Tax=Fonsecaea nubica TaxID=856822 RepID=A0A178CW17_9EURO|nr:hypothetical protein AYO20_07364 [Fonsecaea nubica]OAL33353.1 hypothetical protein AYO20_07364 [Fonsecaea nubica]